MNIYVRRNMIKQWWEMCLESDRTRWECSMYGGESIYLDDYPEFDGAADKSFCICPICEQRLNLV